MCPFLAAAVILFLILFNFSFSKNFNLGLNALRNLLEGILYGVVFFILSALFLAITIVKPAALLPLNKLWLRFGLLLGMIISPIILAVIFFGLFTPIALGMRLFGRDELRLKGKEQITFWKLKESAEQSLSTFEKQF